MYSKFKELKLIKELLLLFKSTFAPSLMLASFWMESAMRATIALKYSTPSRKMRITTAEAMPVTGSRSSIAIRTAVRTMRTIVPMFSILTRPMRMVTERETYVKKARALPTKMAMVSPTT